MRGAEVGFQTAAAVRDAWPPETGRRGFGSGRLNAAPPEVPVERPLSEPLSAAVDPEQTAILPNRTPET
jgi:hypothetical protein